MVIDINSLSETDLRELHRKIAEKLSLFEDKKEKDSFKDLTVILGMDDLQWEFEGADEDFDKWAEEQIGRLNENDRPIIKASVHDVILLACPDDGYRGRDKYYTVDFRDAFHKNKDGKFYDVCSYDYYNDMEKFLPPLPGKARWSHDSENSFSLVNYSHEELKEFLKKEYPFFEMEEYDGY